MSPLHGIKLSKLSCDSTSIADLSPLQGMELAEIRFTPKNISKGMDVIRQMKSLKNIHTGWEAKDTFTPAEFWKKYDAGEFGKPRHPRPSVDRSSGRA